MDSLPETFLASRKPGTEPLVQHPPRLSDRVRNIPDKRVGKQFDYGIAGAPGVSFVPAVAALDEFPIGVWERLRAQVLAKKGAHLLQYASSRGDADLRKAIAAYLCDYRGARCHSDQIIVTAGTQQGMMLSARALVNRREIAWIEDPGFYQARRAFGFAGTTVVPRFYPGPNNVGYFTLGFVCENGEMRALRTLGGNNGFATGANNFGQVVGWAENTCYDATCVPPQVLQFRPVIWGPGHNQIHEFPLIHGDTSGAATALNDLGQAVGISGICDQAIGRHTAKHAVLWDNGRVTDIGNLGALWWNTPTAINERGDVVGFAGGPGDPDGNVLHAFIWTRHDGIRPLTALSGRVPAHVDSEAYGINERRQVVGVSCDADFVDCRAVVWDNGPVPRDLNDLKQPSYTARLEHAKDINDFGDIAGRAIDPVTSVRTAFVAVP